ncbi:diguanylate cyclase, partial [Escherichia coli]|nr:diguanylate cyclase [Escherichia coli]
MCLVDFGLRFNHKGRHYFKAANGEDIALSLSIGAAMFNGHPDHERLIQIADEAL